MFRSILLLAIVLCVCDLTSCAYAQPRLNNSVLISECDFCMGSQGISPLEMGRTGVRYDVRYLRLSRPFSNGIEQPNENAETETHLTQQVTFLYHFLPDLSAAVMLPYSHRQSVSNSSVDPIDGSVIQGESSSTSGLGDVSLLLRYNLLTSHSIAGTTIAAISAGLKLPTGATNGMSSTGELLEPDLQLGTGSLDWILGMSGLIAWERFSIASNISVIVTGRGAHDHAYGNNLSYDLAARYRVYPTEIDFPGFFATLGVAGEYRGMEREYSAGAGWESDPNSGGNITYIAPGLQIFFSPALSFEGSVQIPAIHALNGEQLGERLRIVSGVQYMF